MINVAIIVILWLGALGATRLMEPVVAVLVASIAAVVLTRDEWQRLRSTLRSDRRIVGAAIGASVLMLAVTALSYPLLIESSPWMQSEAALLIERFIAGRSALVMILAVIPVIAAEEWLWRGIVQERLGASRALLAASLYAAAHVTSGSLLLVGVAFVCGVFWSLLRKYTGSLWPGFISHLAWDFALIAASTA